ncbi:MAG TPA: MBL fold metallo-hydrolase [Pseudomonadales bacterium]|nr:MBL fold metallo-hydrolase [Pseudomonadales bacterium]
MSVLSFRTYVTIGGMIKDTQTIMAGVPEALTPLVRRVTAPNAGMMTGPGTNTYLIGWRNVAVIDPGPADEQHVEAILQAVEAGAGRVHSIWVTHTHRDHSPAAALLAARTGAPCYGSLLPDDGFQDQSFNPQVALENHLTVTTEEWSLTAIHTPGHVHNHYCFHLQQEGLMFVGDHMMQGTTVVIIPPHGVMADYIVSLQALLEYPMQAIAPGHGYLIQEPKKVVQATIKHRLARERLLLKKLSGEWQALEGLTKAVYKGLDSRLMTFAGMSLLAHLKKLEAEQKAETDGADHWRHVQKENKSV